MTLIKTIDLKISPETFLEKLKSLTIPISIDKIDQINKRDGSKWFMNLIKQDYDAINKNYNLEQNIFREIEMPEKYIFAGEVSENKAKIYIPDPEEDKATNNEYLMELGGEELKQLFEEKAKIKEVADRYSYDNCYGGTIDDRRLFYYGLEIIERPEGTRVKISKHRFKHMHDGKENLGAVVRRRGLGGDYTFLIPAILILVIVYFVEKFLNTGHNFSNTAAIPVLAIGFIATMMFRLLKTSKHLSVQRNIADEIMILSINKVVESI